MNLQDVRDVLEEIILKASCTEINFKESYYIKYPILYQRQSFWFIEL